MKIENLPDLSKGQIIQVFLINGRTAKGEFAGVACGNLLMNNSVVTGKNSIRHKVNSSFMPVDCIKKIELG